MKLSYFNPSKHHLFLIVHTIHTNIAMVLSRLLFSLFLLSLVLISSAYKYESHDNFQNQFHDQTSQNDNFLPTDFLGHPLPNVFAIQGRVLCNSGSTYFPLQGNIYHLPLYTSFTHVIKVIIWNLLQCSPQSTRI